MARSVLVETGGERITPGRDNLGTMKRDKSQISGQSERVYEEGISHINARAWLEMLKSQMNALPE